MKLRFLKFWTSQTIFHNKFDIKLAKPAKNPKTHQKLNLLQ